MPVRKVSNRGGNTIGHFPSLKMGRMIDYESLIERDLIGASVIELRCAGRGVVGHLRRLFQLTTILQVGGDAGAPKGVVADGRLDASLSCSSFDHIERIAARQRDLR